MKNLYIYTLLTLLCCLNGFSQTEDYIKTEKERIKKAQEIEHKIESFIYQNLQKFSLTPDKEELIRKMVIEESRAHGHEVFDGAIEAELLESKKEELRKLYLKNNPEAEITLKATPIPLSVPADCINGDFEDGLAGYTFTRWRPTDNFYIVDCNVNTSTTDYDAFTPTGTNNFTQEGATLVTPGFDPTLASHGIQMPTVNNGNFALKLNRSSGSRDITTASRQIIPSDNIVAFSFSLIIGNPHPTTPDVQPFFTARIYNGNGDIISNNPICIKADANNSIFEPQVGSGQAAILYTGWICDRLTIPSEYVGQPLRLEFVMTDCGLGAHFGTVYLDDICGTTCDNPPFGSIQLNDQGYNCPTDSFDVCGTLTDPEGSVLSSVVLNILDENGSIFTSVTNPTMNGSAFCFEVDPAVFNNTGEYTFQVIATYTIGTFVYTLSATGATEATDLSFSNGANILNSYVIEGQLYWTDSDVSYDLEFVGDPTCCPDVTHTNPRTNYFATTVEENNINLYYVAYMLNYECFRWRIRTSCGNWSEWCCLTTSQGNDFPPEADWGNPYEPACYDENINLCEQYLYEDENVPADETSFEQREISITAINTINANNGRAIYKAGHFVELLPDFHAEYGSFLLAEIEECVPQTIFNNISLRSLDGGLQEIALVQQSLQPENGFKVYPNPTNGSITVQFEEDVNEFILYDVTGKQLMNISNTAENEAEIDLSNLAPGVYFLTADGAPIQKIVKN